MHEVYDHLALHWAPGQVWNYMPTAIVLKLGKAPNAQVFPSPTSFLPADFWVLSVFSLFYPAMTSIHLPGPLTSPCEDPPSLVQCLASHSLRTHAGGLPGPASGPLCSDPWYLPTVSALLSACPGLCLLGIGQRAPRLLRMLSQK